MRPYPNSLGQKIIFGYLAGLALTLSLVILSWSYFDRLKDMVDKGELVSDLFDTALEIRRFEKNYFLYGTGGDYEELLRYIDKERGLLARKELGLFASPETLEILREELDQYSTLISKEPSSLEQARHQKWEQGLREHGKAIVTVTEGIAANRNTIKNDLLRSARRTLTLGVALLLMLVLAGGLFFYLKAVRPLRVIEKHMDRISEGEFSLIPDRFTDRELVSLKVAFNKMILELQSRQGLLVQSEKLASLGTLVFGVAHELNNPLSNIMTSTQILKEELEAGDPAFKREMLTQIEAECERARDVVRSVLGYSRSKEKESFQLRKAVEETIRFIKAETPPKVTISTDLSAELSLYADRQKIQQMLLNLIKNAIDALQGQGDIYISARASGGRVSLVVRDTGEGISAEALPRIFDPFYTKKKVGGHGLGLFIVHNIVEEHGGTIHVDSEPGQGTAFTISMPSEDKQDG